MIRYVLLFLLTASAAALALYLTPAPHDNIMPVSVQQQLCWHSLATGRPIIGVTCT